MGEPMSKVLAPTDWQSRVLAIPEHLNLALLGGRGGGKTTCATLLALRHAVQYEDRARILVIRSTYRALQQFWEEALALFEQAFPEGLSSNKAEMTVRCPNGAVLSLGNLTTRQDYNKYQGQETTFLIVDEITNFSTLRFVNLLKANLRAAPGVPLRMAMIGNPGGPQHVEISRKYVHGRTPWRPFSLEDGSTWVFCPSTLADNTHIDQARYTASIVASAGGDRALAAAWLHGSWNDLAGSFFGDVWGDHLLIPDTPWAYDRGNFASMISLDWGMSAPAVALLAVRPKVPGALGPAGRVYPTKSWIVLDEVHTARPDDPSQGKGWPPQVLAEEILARAAAWGLRAYGVCDDARGLQGDTLIEQFRRWGLYFQKPTKDRISGWVRLKSMMAAARTNDPDTPALFISERCRLTLETLPLLPRDDLRMEDVDSAANDHAADALRYLVNSNVHGGNVRLIGAY